MINKFAGFFRKNIFVILIIIISLLYLTPLFNTQFYVSHDGEAHVARFGAYAKAFSGGQFIPRWASDLNSGYGTPLFIFFYPLPGYIASFLHVFGLELEIIFKIILFSSFTLAPIFLFLWLKTKVHYEIAFVASVIYLVLPYRFLDTYVRGDIAEMVSFVFIPLIFLFIDKIQKEKKIAHLVMGGFFYSLFILSHNGIAVVFTPVFLAYAFINARNRQEFFTSSGIFVIGITLSSFFWIPAMLEAKYVFSKLFIEGLYKENFIPFWNLFYSPWGFGPDVNVVGGQSPQIGILYATVPFIALFLLKKMKKPIRQAQGKKEIFFWLFVFFFSMFMTTGQSAFIWEKAPVIKLLGYPWRFSALSGFASCMIIFYILQLFKTKIFLYLILALLLVSSLPFVKVNKYIDKNDEFYYSYEGTTDYHRRTSPIWTETDFWKKAKNQFEIISGDGTLENIKRESITHTVTVQAKNKVAIVDNTVYFPGWRVKVNGEKVPIEFQDQNYRGLITFNVPKGMNQVEVAFGESPIRLLSDIISLVAATGLVLALVSRKWIKQYLKI